MTLRRLFPLLLLLAPLPVCGQATEFPNPPSGQVLDTGFWLEEGRRRDLEEELGRYRRESEIDILIVIWDRTMPPETTLEELAQRIGENWAREELWSVILHVPDSLHRPAVVYGGLVAERVVGGATEEALQRGVNRGMKERTERAQVEALGFEVGEEFLFLKNRRALEQKAFVAGRQARGEEREAKHRKMLIQAVIATLVALLAVAAVAVLYLLKRRASECTFPQTRWRRRLGGPWSGGSRIIVSLPRES